MKQNWKTTVLGLLAAVPQLCAMLGVSFGHVGSVTGEQAIGTIGLAGLGWYAADKASKKQLPE